MKTLLGTEIPKTTRGVLYLCHFDFLVDPPRLDVVREILCDSAWRAIELYANIPNPPSQAATGKTYDKLCEELELLHTNMKKKEWLDDLANCI